MSVPYKYVPPADMTEVAGPPIITLALNCGLMGVLAVQVYLYYIAFNRDLVLTKALVYTCFWLEVLQTVLVIDSAFNTYAKGFSDPYVFDRIGKLWLVPPITAIVTFLVQGYYSYRLRILTKSRKVPVIIIFLSVVQLAGGIAVGVNAQTEKFYSLLNTPKMLVVEGVATGLWNLGSILCDLIIAVYMTYYLSRFDTRIRQTKVLLMKIVRLTIETGTVTALVAIICFALAMIPGNPMYYLVPMGIIGKVYANSLMVLLNSRMSLGHADELEGTILSLPRFRRGRNPPGLSNGAAMGEDMNFSMNSDGNPTMQTTGLRSTDTEGEAYALDEPRTGLRVLRLEKEKKEREKALIPQSVPSL